jgi:hypothetical protein
MKKKSSRAKAHLKMSPATEIAPSDSPKENVYDRFEIEGRKPRKPWARFTDARKRKFVRVLRQTASITKSCEATFVTRNTAYDHKEKDTAFSDAWDGSYEAAVDDLESEARRRGLEGYSEPVFGNLGPGLGSGKIGVIKRYSDGLLMFLLKGARPEKFRENSGVSLGISGGVVEFNIILHGAPQKPAEELEQGHPDALAEEGR